MKLDLRRNGKKWKENQMKCCPVYVELAEVAEKLNVGFNSGKFLTQILINWKLVIGFNRQWTASNKIDF